MSNVSVVVTEMRKTYSRSGKVFRAVDDISFELPTSGIFGLLGPNGAGKSTTLEMIAGLRKPDSGSVKVLGMDPFVDRHSITRRLAIQPQKAAVFQHQTVRELLTAWAIFHPGARNADEVIDDLSLIQSANSQVAHLSGGQLQRLLIGSAIISSPEILILDEPSAGLDPNARDDLWEIIRREGERGTTVILSTHSMEEAEALCESLMIMHQGKIVASGTPQGLINQYVPGGEVYFDISPCGHEKLERNEGLQEMVTNIKSRASNEVVSVEVETTDSDIFLKRLLGSELSADVQHITMSSIGLDTVFRTVTGKELNDDNSAPDL